MLQTVISTICEAAKWKAPFSNEKGERYFLLNDNTRLTLFSPDGQLVVMYVNLIPVNSESRAENKDDFIKNLAYIAAGLFKKRQSVLSIDNDTATLHRVLFPAACTPSYIKEQAKNLLNDVDICYTLLSKNNNSSPFSFSTFF